ncbi:MAG: signal peptide peptidase SppA [Thermoguttaceae bacterium]|nr:signal peptide peptidase SppA [Thermoguttaceae bacterium]
MSSDKIRNPEWPDGQNASISQPVQNSSLPPERNEDCKGLPSLAEGLYPMRVSASECCGTVQTPAADELGNATEQGNPIVKPELSPSDQCDTRNTHTDSFGSVPPTPPGYTPSNPAFSGAVPPQSMPCGSGPNPAFSGAVPPHSMPCGSGPNPAFSGAVPPHATPYGSGPNPAFNGAVPPQSTPYGSGPNPAFNGAVPPHSMPYGSGPNPASSGAVPPHSMPQGSIPPGYVPPYGGGNGNYPPQPPWFRGPQPQPRSNGVGVFLLKLILGLFVVFASLGVFMFIGFACLGGLAAALNEMETKATPVSEKTISGSRLSLHKIAILPIEGVIEGKEDGFVRKSIKQALEDDRVVGIVLRINSPGGTMSGSDYYHYLLKDLKSERRVPIVVSMGGMAASGGYYISTVGDKIYAEPSTLTGSIGVIIPLYNAAELCKKLGVSSSAVTSGAMKGMGDFTKPMSGEEKEVWQSLVNSSYEQFLNVIKEGRPAFAPPKAGKKDSTPDKTASKAGPAPGKAEASDKKGQPPVSAAQKESPAENGKEAQPPQSDAQLRKIADGRIYSAQDALKLGLIDKIGFLDDAVREVIKLADVDEGDTQVVRYHNPTGLAALLSESESTARAANVAQLASDMSTPGVWCICPRLIPVKNEK